MEWAEKGVREKMSIIGCLLIWNIFVNCLSYCYLCFGRGGNEKKRGREKDPVTTRDSGRRNSRREGGKEKERERKKEGEELG